MDRHLASSQPPYLLTIITLYTPCRCPPPVYNRCTTVPASPWVGKGDPRAIEMYRAARIPTMDINLRVQSIPPAPSRGSPGGVASTLSVLLPSHLPLHPGNGRLDERGMIRQRFDKGPRGHPLIMKLTA